MARLAGCALAFSLILVADGFNGPSTRFRFAKLALPSEGTPSSDSGSTAFLEYFKFEPSGELQKALGIGPHPPRSPPSETMLSPHREKPYYLDNDRELLSSYVQEVSELVEAAKSEAQTEWSSLSVERLKQELKSRGLGVGGVKAQLVARLENSDQDRLRALANAELAIADAEAAMSVAKTNGDSESVARVTGELRQRIVQEFLNPLMSQPVEKGVSSEAIKGAVALGVALSALFFKSIPLACTVGIGAAYIAVSPGSLGQIIRKVGAITWDTITGSFHFLQDVDRSGELRRKIAKSSVSSFAKLIEVAKEGQRIAYESQQAFYAAQEKLVDVTTAEDEQRLAAILEAEAAAVAEAEAAAEAEVARARAAEEEAHRIAEVEEAKRRAEEEAARVRSAEVEAARIREEEEAARIRAEQEEAARIRAEEEAARIRAEEEAARIRAEEEAARIRAEEMAARIRAEEEAARIRAEEEAVRIRAEEEAARIRAEEEAARIRAEEEEARIRAEEEEAARVRAEEEAARIRAGEEEARIRAEEEAARIRSEEAELRRREEEEEAAAIAAAQKSIDGALAGWNNDELDLDDFEKASWDSAEQVASILGSRDALVDDEEEDEVDYEALGRAARAAVEEFEKRRQVEDDTIVSQKQIWEDDMVSPAQVDWSKLNIAKLRSELESRGLPSSGKKAELVARLEMHDLGVDDATSGPAINGDMPSVAPPSQSQRDWNLLTVAQLRTELKSRGLPTAGKKADLVALLEAVESDEEDDLDDVDLSDFDVEDLGKAARMAVDLFNGSGGFDDEPSDEALWEIENGAVASIASYESMPVAELKDELRRRGLPVSGKKADLVARLEASD